jgi:capsular exopolysaccharide synthesis family protein
MSPLDLLFLLRRHKWVLIVAVAVGLVAGWVTAPGTRHGPQEYEASHTLIGNPESDAPVPNLDQAVLLATTGEVPKDAAKALGVDPSDIVDAVSAVDDLKAQSVTITATSTDPAFAEHAADAVAGALITTLSGNAKAKYDAKVADLTSHANDLRARIDAGPAGSPEVAAAQTDLTSTLNQLNQLQAVGAPIDSLVTVESAQAEPAGTKGVHAPDSKPARAGLLGAFGLLVGLGAVFALDRLDTRIHTKAAAEAAFGFPVLAEIPPLPPGAHRELLSETHPGSPFVEAYRSLRTYLALATEDHPGQHGVTGAESGKGTVILVTSPLAGEGKTTSVAHMAAMLGEVGRSVLVVSGDFRRPRLHELFHRERGPGLSEVLAGGPGAPDIADLNLATSVKGVQFIASGAPTSNPAVIVKRTPQVLEAAKPYWDYILVDSAPLLVANDSSDLARAANGVIVLARSGRTTIDAAERTAELLKRIEAPVLGVVLIASAESPTAYRYYRTKYYGDAVEPSGRWRRGPRQARGAPPPPSSNGNGRTGPSSQRPVQPHPS